MSVTRITYWAVCCDICGRILSSREYSLYVNKEEAERFAAQWKDDDGRLLCWSCAEEVKEEE